MAANLAGFVETNLDRVPEGGSIQLQPWGRIEGSLPESERARSDVEIWIMLKRDPLSGLGSGGYFPVKPDQAGRFILPRVPPGQIWVWWQGAEPPVSEDGRTRSSNSRVLVDVRPGEVTQANFEAASGSAGK
jgi:hypothetical protein